MYVDTFVPTFSDELEHFTNALPSNPPRPAATPPEEGTLRNISRKNPLLGRGARSAGWVLPAECGISIR